MKKLRLLLLCTSTIFFACKKEKEKEPADEGVTKTVCVGSEQDGTKPGYLRAIIWVDGKQSRLSEEYSFANKVLISGGNVYVTGSVDHKPVYWKNGILNSLPYAGGFGSGGVMSVYDGNQYIVGESSGQVTLWKNNNIYKQLPREDSSGYYSPMMHNNDFYYIKMEIKGGVWTYSVSKNETPTPLAGSNGLSVYFLAVTNNDIYAVANDKSNGEIFIWKNNVKTSVVKSADTTLTRLYVMGVEADGTDVYVFYQVHSPKSGTSSYSYWKNGTVYSLSASSDFYPYVNKMINGKMYRGGWLNRPGANGATYYVDNEIHQLNNQAGFLVTDIAVGKVK